MVTSARRPMVAGNWKMNLNHLEGIALVQKLAFSLTERELTDVEVVVLPPYTALRGVQTLVDGDRLRIGYGAQDISPHPAGPYTGDIAGFMLAKLGCSYVVVGHSERRAHHGETDDVVRAKVMAAYDAGLTPIVCVGEPLEVRRGGAQVGHCTDQLAAVAEGLGADRAAGLVVAYEPVWAIGTGEVATPADAQEVSRALRGVLARSYSAELSAEVRILYGGSVTAANIAGLMREPDVDGALVGGASLDAVQFVTICRLGDPAA